MKIALCFRYRSNVLTSLCSVEGQFLTNDREKSEKKQSLKSIKPAHTSSPFSRTSKNDPCGLVGACPKPQKAKSKTKNGTSLRSCLFKSKSTR